ncbi:MAG: OsmC family protein [Caulobacterales bacterium]|nr:OsmC family protein [Caulobacterales bacterium]
MAAYTATIDWTLKPGEDFVAGRYSRGHTVTFDSGITIPASSSPSVVPLPWSVAEAVDPEEMLVAALSNCHMLTFLHKAREAGFVVTAYRDQAEGVMRKTAEGKIAVTRVTMRPEIAFDGRAPDADQLEALHHAAHEDCFIASSVKTEVVVEAPRPTDRPVTAR